MGILDKSPSVPGSQVEPLVVAAVEPVAVPTFRRWAWLIGAVAFSLGLTFLIARSTLRPGYLLQVDAAFGPKAPPYIGGFYAPVWALEKLLVVLFGGAVTGRIYLFGVLFFAGFLPMTLLRRYPWWAQLFAGSLGMLNPFTYDRLVEGQWTVVASCDGLFLWLILWCLIDERPTLMRGMGLAFATFVVVSFSAHFAGILLVLAAACVIGSRSWRSPARARTLGFAGGLCLLALTPGAVLFFTDTGGATVSQLSGVTNADLHFFRPTGASPFGLLDMFGLYGYWGERLGRFPVATSWSPWWFIAAVALVALSVVGACSDRRRAWLLASGYFGIAVSLLIATSLGRSVFSWLAAHVDVLRGYREPEKWSALWLIALVVLGAIALARIGTSHFLSRPLRAVVVGVAFVAILLPAGVTEIRGARLTLAPVVYPKVWYIARADLSKLEAPRSRVMILPWHLYEDMSISGGRPAENPGDVFFPGRILTSQTDDIPGDTQPVGTPGWAEATGSHNCSLSQVARSYRADFVVIEPAPGADADITRLLACGMIAIIRLPQITVLARPVSH